MANRRGSYYFNVMRGLDYFAATVFGIPSGIFISSYAAYKRADSGGKWQWVTLEKVINWLFRDERHCLDSMGKNMQDIEIYYK